MHATRVPERLTGMLSSGGGGGSLHIPPSLSNILRKRLDGSGSGSSPRSRSRSPSLKDGTTTKATTTTTITSATMTMGDATNSLSSISSLEDIVGVDHQDILYDRAGFVELSESDVSSERRRLHNSREFANLTPVCERSSEDMLEDAHAFADPVVSRSSNASRATTNSIGTGADQFLEPLNEDDEEDDLDDITEEDEQETHVILTNLDNISLSDDYRMEARAGTRGTGESSLVEEAPSAPSE
jgi:hypothetical protein